MPRGVYPRSEQCKSCAFKEECAKTNSFLPDTVMCLDYHRSY